MFNYFIDSLIVAIPSFVILLTGLVLAWTTLGVRFMDWLILLPGHLILVEIFFAITGCFVGINEIKILKDKVKYYGFRFAHVDRRFLLVLDGVLLLIVLGFSFPVYLANGSSEGLLKTAFLLIALGGGFSLTAIVALLFVTLTSLVLYLKGDHR
jgi:hypothetical protein